MPVLNECLLQKLTELSLEENPNVVAEQIES